MGEPGDTFQVAVGRSKDADESMRQLSDWVRPKPYRADAPEVSMWSAPPDERR